MNPRDEAARNAILARLAESRAEILRVLEPGPEDAAEANPDAHAAGGGFPRSRTMRMLLSGRGLGAIGATAAGLLMARPSLAWRLIRVLPAGALMRVLVSRLAGSLRAKHSEKP